MGRSGRQSVGELDWITGCACLTHRRSIIPMPTLYAHCICPYMQSIMPRTSNTHCICPYMPSTIPCTSDTHYICQLSPTLYAHCICHVHQIPSIYAHICHLLCHAQQMPTICKSRPALVWHTDAHLSPCPRCMPIYAIYYAMHIKYPLHMPKYAYLLCRAFPRPIMPVYYANICPSTMQCTMYAPICPSIKCALHIMQCTCPLYMWPLRISIIYANVYVNVKFWKALVGQLCQTT